MGGSEMQKAAQGGLLENGDERIPHQAILREKGDLRKYPPGHRPCSWNDQRDRKRYFDLRLLIDTPSGADAAIRFHRFPVFLGCSWFFCH